MLTGTKVLNHKNFYVDNTVIRFSCSELSTLSITREIAYIIASQEFGIAGQLKCVSESVGPIVIKNKLQTLIRMIIKMPEKRTFGF